MALQVWLPLNGTLDNQGFDEDIAITNNGAAIDNGIYGKCYSFNGTSLSVSNMFYNDVKEFTVCAWVKLLDGYHLNYGCHLISIDNYLRICISKDGHAISFIAPNIISGSTLNNTVLKTNKWYHFAVTFYKGIASFYINGQLDSQIDVGTTTLPNTSVDYVKTFNIGSYGIEKAVACINDYRIYDNVLSSREIKEIFKGLVCHYPMGDIVVNPNLLYNSSMVGEELVCDSITNMNSITSKAYESEGFHIVTPNSGNKNNGCGFHFNDFTELGISPNDTIIFSLDVKGSSVGQLPYINIHFKSKGSNWFGTGIIQSDASYFEPTDEFQRVSVIFTLPSEESFTYKDMWLAVHGNFQSDLIIKNLKLEKGTKATSWLPAFEYEDDNKIYDVSGYGYNGVPKLSSKSLYDKNAPKYSGSQSFNGITDYISLINPITANNSFTIATWVYLNEVRNNTLICSRTTMGSGISLFILPESIRFDDGIQTSYSFNASDNLNKWFHTCAVRNVEDSSKKIYINGTLLEQATQINQIGNFNGLGKNFLIGASQNSDTGVADGNYLNGKIVDFRIYCSALSESDIKDLYKVPASLSNNGTLLCKGEYIEW